MNALKFSAMEVFYGKNQVPVFPPDDVSIFQTHFLEMPQVKVFVILRVWVFADEFPDVYPLSGIVAE